MKASEDSEFDILIVGAGLAGASLACALAATPLRVGLIEERAPRRIEGWDARVYSLSPANVAFLEALRIWPLLDAERINQVETIEVFGDAGGRLDFSAWDAGLDALAWISEAGPIALELWETLRRQAGITLIEGNRPAALEVLPEHARLTLTDGRELKSRLIVAADGADSWVRKAAGLEARVSPYHEQGVVANFTTEKPHFDTARQWFREDGILAWLPLPGNRISMVWSAPDALAAELMSLAPDALAGRVAEAGGHCLGQLAPLTPAAAFPLRLIRVPTTVAPRIALIGDAAHAIHPLSGHGINLGFQDAKVLADVLGALPDYRDCGELSVLRRYARARAEEVQLMQAATHALNRLFRPAHPLLSRLRNAGMSLTSRIPVAKTVLIRYAAGLI